jgi:hypothetical protein
LLFLEASVIGVPPKRSTDVITFAPEKVRKEKRERRKEKGEKRKEKGERRKEKREIKNEEFNLN